jgi:hypothetical protein
MIASLWARRRCNRKLEHGLWAAFAHPPDVAGVVAPRLGGADADVDSNARGAQPRMARAGDLRVGVFERGDHAGDAGGNDGIGAGRRLAEMRARLERHVKRGAARRLAGAAERLDLGMRPAADLRPAAADNDSAFDDDRADGRIWPGAPKPAPAQGER